MKIYFFFCISPPIFFHDMFDDMIRLINSYTLFTLYYGDIEDIWCWPFLEDIIK